MNVCQYCGAIGMHASMDCPYQREIESRQNNDRMIDGRPRCGECGHTMSADGHGYKCIENTCSIGLAVLGDFHSAKKYRARNGGYVW